MRILIVEDDTTIANALQKGLTLESYAVDVANDGLTGYDLASAESYDIIVLDRMIPNMSGDEICAALRKDNIHTPILMLTAKHEVEDRVTGLNIGADDYLTKPFAFDELLARLRALSRRPPTTEATTLTVRDLSINTLTYEVERAKKAVALSKKEYALLSYLVRNKSRTMSKEQIIQHVWSFDDDILPNTVEVYIRYLRNKIDKPFPDKKPLIKTIRGFGYKIE